MPLYTTQSEKELSKNILGDEDLKDFNVFESPSSVYSSHAAGEF